MQTQTFFGVENAYKATGVVVMIDVFRAATTAACAFAQGVEEIIPVATKEEAFAHKKIHQNVLLMGEEQGIPISGFDFGNSPYLLAQEDLTGKTMIHRSTQGTQGIIQAIHADTLVFGGFVTARAIYLFVQEMQPKVVSFVALAGENTEDHLFAQYLQSAIIGTNLDMSLIRSQLRASFGSTWFFDPRKPNFPEEDFSFCLDTDKYDFVVEAVREPYLHLVKKII